MLLYSRNIFIWGGLILPNIKSAKKRVLTIASKTQRNKARNSALKTAISKAIMDVNSSSANAEVSVKAALKNIDMAVSKGILHKNTAARKKSKLMHKFNSVSA